MPALTTLPSLHHFEVKRRDDLGNKVDIFLTYRAWSGNVPVDITVEVPDQAEPLAVDFWSDVMPDLTVDAYGEAGWTYPAG